MVKENICRFIFFLLGGVVEGLTCFNGPYSRSLCPQMSKNKAVFLTDLQQFLNFVDVRFI